MIEGYVINIFQKLVEKYAVVENGKIKESIGRTTHSMVDGNSNYSGSTVGQKWADFLSKRHLTYPENVHIYDDTSAANLKKSFIGGKGRFETAIAIYHWMHTDKYHPDLPKEVDAVVFGKDFEQVFSAPVPTSREEAFELKKEFLTEDSDAPDQTDPAQSEEDQERLIQETSATAAKTESGTTSSLERKHEIGAQEVKDADKNVHIPTDASQTTQGSVLKRMLQSLKYRVFWGASACTVALIALPLIVGQPREFTNHINHKIALYLIAGEKTSGAVNNIYPAQPSSFGSALVNQIGFRILELLNKREHAPATAKLGARISAGYMIPKEVKRGFTLSKIAADAGEPLGQLSTAIDYKRGAGVARNSQKAMDYFKALFANPKAEGTSHYALGKAHIGRAYLDGTLGLPVNFEAARANYEIARQLNSGDGSFGLGRMYKFGYGVSKDFTKAGPYFDEALKKGNILAAAALADMYAQKRVPNKDIDDGIELLNEIEGEINPFIEGKLLELKEMKAKAAPTNVSKPTIKDYEAAAELDSGYAIWRLIKIHDEGELGEVDKVRALRWVRRLENIDNGYYLNQLGDYYQKSMTPNRYERAKELFERAACLGNADAFSWLGYLVEQNRVEPSSFDRAFYLFKQGAERGDAWAKNKIGRIYLDKNTIPYDPKQGRYWMRQAALTGDARVKREYALSPETKNHPASLLAKDDPEAYELLLEAAEAGDGTANLYLATWIYGEDYDGSSLDEEKKATLQKYMRAVVKTDAASDLLYQFGLYDTLNFDKLDPEQRQLLTGIGIHESEARSLVEQAANTGMEQAYRLIFDDLVSNQTNLAEEMNLNKLDEWFKKYLKQGRLSLLFDDSDAEAIKLQANLRRLLTNKSAVIEAMGILEKRAQEGHRNAIKLLPIIFDKSGGVPAFSKKPAWFKELEKRTKITLYPYDEITIARLYRDGILNFKPDALTASNWYTKAIRHGSKLAVSELLDMYTDGRLGADVHKVVELLKLHFVHAKALDEAKSLLEKNKKSELNSPGEAALKSELQEFIKEAEEYGQTYRIDAPIPRSFQLDCQKILSRP